MATTKIDLTWTDKAIGRMLYQFNTLESNINNLIFAYFQPSREAEAFKNTLLNSSVLGMGPKIKILANMTDFDTKILDRIRRVANIRNSVAHNNPGGFLDVKKHEGSVIISVMNSSGKLKNLKLAEQEKLFYEHCKEIDEYLKGYGEKLME